MPGIPERIFRLIHEEKLHLLRIALGEIYDLGVLDVGRPDVAIGRDDDLLHQAELAAEGVTPGWSERFAGLVELDDGLATVAGAPDVVLGVDGEPETDALNAATGESEGHRRERLAVGRELGKVPGPEGIQILRADDHIVARPNVPLTVDHQLAGRTQPTPGEFERQDPGTRSPAEIRHERNRPQILAIGNGVESVQQREQSLRLVAGVASDSL